LENWKKIEEKRTVHGFGGGSGGEPENTDRGRVSS